MEGQVSGCSIRKDEVVGRSRPSGAGEQVEGKVSPEHPLPSRQLRPQRIPQLLGSNTVSSASWPPYRIAEAGSTVGGVLGGRVRGSVQTTVATSQPRTTAQPHRRAAQGGLSWNKGSRTSELRRGPRGQASASDASRALSVSGTMVASRRACCGREFCLCPGLFLGQLVSENWMHNGPFIPSTCHRRL